MQRSWLTKIRTFLFILGLAFSISITVNAQETCPRVFSFQNRFGVVSTGQHGRGAALFYKADSRLKGPLSRTIRIGTYNVLNLYDHVPMANKEFPLTKERSRRQGNARSITKINPDFQIIVEAENTAALNRFNNNYLEGQYEPLLLPGNDHGVEVAILVKRDLPINFTWRSYKNQKDGSGNRIFSRDLPVGLVYERDENGNSLKQPKFAVLATHYKSQRTDPEKHIDTADIRRQQVIATLAVVAQIRHEFGQDMPIFLAGDFNNDVHRSPEFSALFKNGFQDTLDMQAAPPKDRATHFYFAGGKNARAPETNQLDAILVSGKNVRVNFGKVIADTDANGNQLAAPRSFEERESRPSDHLPIGIEVEI